MLRRTIVFIALHGSLLTTSACLAPEAPPCDPTPETWGEWNRSLVNKCVDTKYICRNVTFEKMNSARIAAMSDEQRGASLQSLAAGSLSGFAELFRVVSEIRDENRCPALPDKDGTFDSKEDSAVDAAALLWAEEHHGEKKFPRRLFRSQIQRSRETSLHPNTLTCVRLAKSWRDLYPECIGENVGDDLALNHKSRLNTK
jgi:hypothetical protein